MAQWMALHGRKNPSGVLAPAHCQKFAFVGQIQGVETQEFADSSNLFPDRNPLFVDQNVDSGSLCPFIERSGHTSAGRIPETDNPGNGFEHARH